MTADDLAEAGIVRMGSEEIGTSIAAVDPAEYDAVGQTLSEAWRPHVFEDLDRTSAAIYRFSISERSGLKQTGLPPALQRDADGSNE